MKDSDRHMPIKLFWAMRKLKNEKRTVRHVDRNRIKMKRARERGVEDGHVILWKGGAWCVELFYVTAILDCKKHRDSCIKISLHWRLDTQAVWQQEMDFSWIWWFANNIAPCTKALLWDQDWYHCCLTSWDWVLCIFFCDQVLNLLCQMVS